MSKVKTKPKMVKLFGGGQRPETKIDRDMAKRLAKVEKAADPAGAFKLASDTETPLLKISRAVVALRYIALSEECAYDPTIYDALFGLVDTIEDASKELSGMCEQIATKTWAYGYGSKKAAA